ncbi:MAG: polysaccharide biosynthesis/export family protein [Bryobacterales bacterium]|nr:polysaccharide biosynthesis/export family protein [Bryobacterales bacterium]MBV9399729.1 polysaccharide biosynthesis/export family protein [Bryobacterales bacterium]
MGRKCLALLIATTVSAAALAQGQNTHAPRPSPEDPVKVEAPRVTPGLDLNVAGNVAGAAVEPNTYVIGPLDLLYVKVFRDSDFSGQYFVRTDGKITLPLIGDIQASGLTPVALAGQVKMALSEYIIKPDVNVMVYQVNSKTYTVAGEVNRPGRFPLLITIRAFDAINEAGGFKDFANKTDITIIRGNQRLKFNYEDVRKGKKLAQNIELQNGDTVLVR